MERPDVAASLGEAFPWRAKGWRNKGIPAYHSCVDNPVVTSAAGSGGSRFATTHWSVVLAATDAGSEQSREAFGALYQAYSQPLYGFVRRRGHPPADAQDLLHDFFQALIEKNYLKSFVQERGRFRAFLLGSLRHFLANDWNRIHRAKRGGLQVTIRSRIDVECWIPRKVS